jgi:hypothetical protein
MSFRGGGLILPARSPYDRQILIEHVVDRANVSGDVQVLLDGQRWQVQAQRGQLMAGCAHCGAPLYSACYSAANRVAFCVNCAFGGETVPEAVHENRSGQMR